MTYIVPIKNTLSVTVANMTYDKEYFNTVISTDAADKANTDWDSVTTFAKDSWTRIPELKRVYRCAAATSTDEYPPANPSVWIDYGATNSYKLFDDIIGSQTEFATTMTIELEANRMNSIAFLNMDEIIDLRITQTDLNTNVVEYDKTISLINYGVVSLYDYWYKPVRYTRDISLLDLVYMTNGKLTLTFTSANVGKIGALVTGLADEIGLTLTGSKVKLKDYSKYSVDVYGNTTFAKRGYARIITGSVVIDTNTLDETLSKLADLRGSLTLYVGDESSNGFSSFTTLGYIEEVEIEPVQTKTKYPIKIIGVI